jgi:hypothetical protein
MSRDVPATEGAQANLHSRRMYLLTMLGTTRSHYLSPLGVQGSPQHSQGRLYEAMVAVVWCPAGEEGLEVGGREAMPSRRYVVLQAAIAMTLGLGCTTHAPRLSNLTVGAWYP